MDSMPCVGGGGWWRYARFKDREGVTWSNISRMLCTVDVVANVTLGKPNFEVTQGGGTRMRQNSVASRALGVADGQRFRDGAAYG